MATGYVWHELYGWHDTGTNAGLLPGNSTAVQPYLHFESPESKQRFHSLVEVSGLAAHLVRLTPQPATDEDILRCHTQAHLDRITAESANPRGGDAGDGTSPFGHAGIDIARLAAGGSIGLSVTVGLIAPYPGDLTVTPRDMVLRNPDLFETRVNGAIRIAGPLTGGARISGSITLPETEIRVPSTDITAAGAIPDIVHRNESAAVRATLGRAGLLDREARSRDGLSRP